MDGTACGWLESWWESNHCGAVSAMWPLEVWIGGRNKRRGEQQHCRSRMDRMSENGTHLQLQFGIGGRLHVTDLGGIDICEHSLCSLFCRALGGGSYCEKTGHASTRKHWHLMSIHISLCLMLFEHVAETNLFQLGCRR